MPADHTESAFESGIEAHLLAHGYRKGNPADFDRVRALDPATFLAFLRDTQPDLWAFLQGHHGDNTEAIVLKDLCDALEAVGTLSVLRHGFKCFGKLLRVAFFAPPHTLNPETRRLYDANRLTVTRQVRYGADHDKSLDVLLSLNGLPVATAELKNPFTGQSAEHARQQYRHDRDPHDLLFRFRRHPERALVHFAVDPDEVSMTTRLAGVGTVFLPFNRGNDGGAGNPDNPHGHRTAYLWAEVWQRDSLLDVLAHFVHLQVTEEKRDGKKVRKEALIFPRYHQLDAVRQLLAEARGAGPGAHYLVQHSAGSGKSNTIAWLAHRLASLHDAADRCVFDAVRFMWSPRWTWRG